MLTGMFCCAVLRVMGVEASNLYPNNLADTPATAAISAIEVSQQLAALLAFDNVVVGWNTEDLMALHIALPAMHEVALVRDPLIRQVFQPILWQIGLLQDPTSFRLQLPKLIFALITGKCKIRRWKSKVRNALVDAWIIAALWPHFGKVILKERHCATSLFVPRSHSWMGTANSLEYMVSGTEVQFLPPDMNLLAEDLGTVRRGVNSFERVMMKCNVENELPPLKLAKTAEEAYQNL